MLSLGWLTVKGKKKTQVTTNVENVWNYNLCALCGQNVKVIQPL